MDAGDRADVEPIIGTPFHRLRVGGDPFPAALGVTYFDPTGWKVERNAAEKILVRINNALFERDTRMEVDEVRKALREWASAVPDLAGPFDALRETLAEAARSMTAATEAIAKLAEVMEDVEDAADGYAALAAESYPAELIDSIAAGENPVRAFRKFRDMSQAALAEEAGIRQGTISQIQRGHLARVDTFAAVARALRTDIELLLPRAGH